VCFAFAGTIRDAFLIKNDLMRSSKTSGLPRKTHVIRFTRNLCVYLFPEVEGCARCSVTMRQLRRELVRVLYPVFHKDKKEAKQLARAYLESVGHIQKILRSDAEFISASDPAASGPDEVIMTYPGFFAIMVYRLAHSMHNLGVPLIPRVMTEHAHSVTGIDIHPGANIGECFCIDHGNGVVIGESTVIGRNVKIYQGVTLGALSVKKEDASRKRHPTVEDHVIIYAGSTILGGQTVVGHHSIVGGNVWLTESLPPHSVIYQETQNTIKQRSSGNKRQDT